MNQDKEMNNTSPAEYYEDTNPEKVAEKEKKRPDTRDDAGDGRGSGA